MKNKMISNTCKNLLTNTQLETPSFIIDETIISQALQRVYDIKNTTKCKVIYSVKSLTDADIMRKMAAVIDGFSTSSLFEATLARSIAPDPAIVHIVTPSYKIDEIDNIAEQCNFVTLNSYCQYERFQNHLHERTNIGLRINPQLSFIDDKRYNPCGVGSKLGVPIEQLEMLIKNKKDLSKITGLHFHTNCESKSLEPLLKTVEHIINRLGDFLHQIKWINLGGGYLFEFTELEPLYQAISLLRSKYQLDIFIEPGRTMVQSAGFLIASVVDIFENGKTIAVLDTSVNHMAEVYEYQFSPSIFDHNANGQYAYILTGSSCLAGDVFGEYVFDKPLEIGTRIIFTDMGAYTQVKATMFNGINRPTIYHRNQAGEVILKKRYSYDDFLSHCGKNTKLTSSTDAEKNVRSQDQLMAYTETV